MNHSESQESAAEPFDLIDDAPIQALNSPREDEAAEGRAAEAPSLESTFSPSQLHPVLNAAQDLLDALRSERLDPTGLITIGWNEYVHVKRALIQLGFGTENTPLAIDGPIHNALVMLWRSCCGSSAFTVEKLEWAVGVLRSRVPETEQPTAAKRKVPKQEAEVLVSNWLKENAKDNPDAVTCAGPNSDRICCQISAV